MGLCGLISIEYCCRFASLLERTKSMPPMTIEPLSHCIPHTDFGKVFEDMQTGDDETNVMVLDYDVESYRCTNDTGMA